MGKFSEAYLDVLCFAIRSGAMDGETMKNMIKIYGDWVAAEEYDEMINGTGSVEPTYLKPSPVFNEPSPVFNASLLSKKLRSENMLQKDLAKALNITRHTVGKWIHGRSQPSAEKMAALTEFFHVDPKFFLMESEDEA